LLGKIRRESAISRRRKARSSAGAEVAATAYGPPIG
jgi:hypothetical protein